MLKFIPRGVIIIEPFCGKGDIVNYISNNLASNQSNNTHSKNTQFECYDKDPHPLIDPCLEVSHRDTLMDPPDYSGKYVITNPPYLARNKSVSKEIFDKYKTNDLYKAFIIELLTNSPVGGILIIPLNFWCSIRKGDALLRKNFIRAYEVMLLNIFNEQVFEDTSYTICAFSFRKREVPGISAIAFPAISFPDNKLFNISLNEDNNYIIGGEIYLLPENSKYKITRITNDNHELANNKILIKCVDDNGRENEKTNERTYEKTNEQMNYKLISLRITDEIYVDNTHNKSSRTYASIIIDPPIDMDRQVKLVNDFNRFMNVHREKYSSLFLTNYRENGRKRISFELVYKIIRHLLIDTF
jgi:hypothetical protein